MPKVVALIPARSGSKGVKNKNVKVVDGHPLLAYSIVAACFSTLIDEVYVSTDSKSYAEIAASYGAKTPFLRPIEISSDNASDKEFVMHFIEWCRSNRVTFPDYIVHLRPTTPLRDPELIDRAIHLISTTLEGVQSTALRSVHEMSESAYKVTEIEGGFLKRIFDKQSNLDFINLPRQSYPLTYLPNGYVDILKVPYLLSTEGFHGDKVIPYITPLTIEIDTEQDFDQLSYVLEKERHKVSALLTKRKEHYAKIS